MSEEEEYLRSLTKERLMLTPHDIYKLHCSVEGCCRFARVKDFGIAPFYYWGRYKFIDLSATTLLCGKHWQYKKRGHLSRLIRKPGAGVDHLVFDKSVL